MNMNRLTHIVIGGLLLPWLAVATDAPDLRLNLRDFRQESVTWNDTYPDLRLRGFGTGSGLSWKRLAVRMELQDRKAGSDDSWLDELELRWDVVLAMGRRGVDDRADPKHSFRFQRTVKYMNVRASKKGTEYWAMIYLPPEVMQRFGRRDDIPDSRLMGKIDVHHGVRNVGTIWFIDGKAELSERVPNRTLNSFVNSEDPQPAKHGLLTRPESPWAYSSSDSDKLMRLAPVSLN